MKPLNDQILLALYEVDEIPTPILEGWKSLWKQDPIEDAFNLRRVSMTLFLLGMTCTAICLLLLAYFSVMEKKGSDSAILPFGIGMMCFCACAFTRPREQKCHFGKILSKFSEILQLNYGQLAGLSQQEWKSRADAELFRLAHLIKSCQGGPQVLLATAEDIRKCFRETHKLFYNFGFADITWDRYFYFEKRGAEEKPEVILGPSAPEETPQ